MKVLLVNPPSYSVITEILGVRGPPLGLAYLASVIREEGFDVSILDAIGEGLDVRETINRIQRYDPDLIGITATTPAIYDAYMIAKLVKRVNPNVKVVIGGSHVTFMPIQTLQDCPYVDVVVIGEGELIVRDLLSALSKGRDLMDVKGIAFRRGRELKMTPPAPLIMNLDKLPIPAYDLLPLDKYIVGSKRYGVLITSRGCPYRCLFCSSSLQFGRRWRAYSPGRVLEELKILYYEYGVREVEFLDDMFTLDRERSIEIASMIRREGLDISWTFSSRVNTFTSEVGTALRKAGAWLVYFGIESGSERVLKYIRKGITVSQSVKAVKSAKRSGLKVLGSFIVGFPIERRGDLKLTLGLARMLDIDYAQFTVATPFPGTELWEIANRDGLLLTRDWSKYTTLNVVMKGYFLSPNEIQRFLELAYILFYLSPKRIKKDLTEDRGFLLRKVIKSLVKLASLKIKKC